jgi:hypothetical protein
MGIGAFIGWAVKNSLIGPEMRWHSAWRRW